MMRLFLSYVLLALTVLPLHAQDVQGLVLPVKIVSVSSPVLQEVIDSVLVEEGHVVKEGDVLVQLRSEKESLEVEQAKKLIEARSFSAKGAEALYKDKITSKEQALEKGVELDLARIQLAAAEVRFKEKTVRAPLAGIVVKKYKESGESVDRAEKLIDIVNIDQVFVQFYLDPKFMQILQLEQPVTVRFPVSGNLAFTGKISFIDPRIDAGSGLFRIKVLIDNPDHQIKAGMRGVADFAKLQK
jgi:RND family efflux transporter MFP subunit